MFIIRFALALAVLFAGFALPARAESFSPEQKTELDTLIHTYLTEHPEVLREMMTALEAKDKKDADAARMQVITTASKDLFHDATDGVGGNPKGDVTLVEFMDFNCGVCKHTFSQVQAAMTADPNLRVVMKEWPVIGGAPSEYAAKAVLAVQKQGKYWALHKALYENVGTVTPEVVDKLAKANGVDVAKMKADMEDPAIKLSLAKTNQLAQDLQLTGTPGFVIGTRVLPGAESADGLLATIAEVRANGGCKAC